MIGIKRTENRFFINDFIKLKKYLIKSPKRIIKKAIRYFFLRYSYWKDLLKFKQKSKNSPRFSMSMIDIKPMLYDNTKNTIFDRHYVYHPAWAARVVAKIKPKYHVDISSTLYFCSIVSSFVPVKFYDYRPASLRLSGLESYSADLLELPFKDNTLQSISCMHTIEHVGLGRYGDPIDPEGDLKAINELKRVVAVDGNLLIVVPIGCKAKIQFNAHRIYSYKQLIGYFSSFKLEEFALITEKSNEGLLVNPSQNIVNNVSYGCGCFWFKKKKTYE